MNLHRNISLLILIGLIISMFLMNPVKVMAQDPPLKIQADILMNRGGELYEAGDKWEALEKFEQARTLYNAAGYPVDEANALNGGGEIKAELGRYVDALEAFEQARDIYRDAGEQEREAKTLTRIGLLYSRSGKYLNALSIFHQALSLLASDSQDAGRTINNIGAVYLNQGWYDDAKGHFDEALKIAEEIADREGAATTLVNFGTLYRKQELYPQALTAYQDAFAMKRELGDTLGEAATLLNIGDVHLQQGDACRDNGDIAFSQEEYAKALEAYQNALTIYQREEHQAGEATALANIAKIRLRQEDQGDYVEILQQLLDALTLCREIGNSSGELEVMDLLIEVYHETGDNAAKALALTDEGEIYYQQGRHDKADHALTQALLLYKYFVDDPQGELRAWVLRGESALAIANYDKAISCFDQALTLLEANGDAEKKGCVLTNLGEAHLAQGNYPEAIDALEQALLIHDAMDNRAGKAQTLMLLGEFSLQQGDYDDALEKFEEALPLQREADALAGEARTLMGMGEAHLQKTEYPAAMTAFQDALSIYQQAGDHPREGRASARIGEVHHIQGQQVEALDAYQEALDKYREGGELAGQSYVLEQMEAIHELQEDDVAQAATLIALGTVYRDQGKYAEAQDAFDQALALYIHLNDPTGEAEALRQIGITHCILNAYTQSRNFLDQALSIYQTISDQAGKAAVLENIGELEFDRAQYNSAKTYYEQALAIYQNLDDRASEGRILMKIGYVYQALGMYAEAAEIQKQAVIILAEVDDHYNLILALMCMGEAYEAQGLYWDALEAYRRALGLMTDTSEFMPTDIPVLPTPTPTPTSPMPTPTSSPVPTSTPVPDVPSPPTFTPTPILTTTPMSPTPTATTTPIPTPTFSPVPVLTPVPDATSRPTVTPTPLLTATPTSPAPTATAMPISTPTPTPTVPPRSEQTPLPTPEPLNTPTPTPTLEVPNTPPVTPTSTPEPVKTITPADGEQNSSSLPVRSATATATPSPTPEPQRKKKDRSYSEHNQEKIGALEKKFEAQQTLHHLPGQIETGEEIVDLALLEGNDDLAASYLDQLIEVFRQLGKAHKELEALNQKGLIHIRQQDYVQAELAFRKAARGDDINRAQAYNNLGVLRYEQRQYNHAREFLDTSLMFAEHAQDYTIIATALNNRALVDFRKGQELERQKKAAEAHEIYEQALQNFRQALHYFQLAYKEKQIPEDRQSAGTVLNNIGLIYHRLGHYTAALDQYEQALRIIQEVGGRGSESAVLHNIGTVYASLQHYGDALESLQQALQIERKIDNLVDEARTLSQIGYIYEIQSESLFNTSSHHLSGITQIFRQNLAFLLRETAVSFYLQAIALQEDIRSGAKLEEFKISIAEGFVNTYQQVVQLLARMNRGEEAFLVSERARARTFLDLLGNKRFDMRKGVKQELLEQEWEQRQEIHALYQQLKKEQEKPLFVDNTDLIDELKAEIAEQQKQYAELFTQIKVYHPEYAFLVSVSPPTLAEIQEILDEETSLLSYFVTPQTTLLFVISQDSFEVIELVISAHELTQKVLQTRTALDAEEAIDQDLQELYDLLIAPVEASLHTTVVGIVPHSALHYLPFAALVQPTSDPNNGISRYLGEKYTLFALPSASVLPLIQKQSDPRPKQQILVMANKGYPPIKHAEEEAIAIADLYDTTPVLGEEATGKTFVESASTAEIIHLSSHAKLNSQSPLSSGFLLHDGYLAIHDLYGLNLEQTDLAVLSACSTQVGQQSRGDDIIALNRAFLYAGASSVVASLWNVDDAATSELMVAFHRHLTHGLSKAEALRQAQSDARVRYPHPYYWAAFVLTGEPGKPEHD